MKQFRYVIGGQPCGWLNCKNYQVERLQIVSQHLNKIFINDWYIEFR